MLKIRAISTYPTFKISLLSLSLLLLAGCGGGTTGTTGIDLTPATTTTTTIPVATLSGTLSTACTGATCGAVSSSLYSGTGTGIWAYNNTTSSNASINIDIAGVSADKQVTLAFSNGSSTNAASVPYVGVQSSTEPLHFENNSFHPMRISAEQALRYERHEAAHDVMLHKNQTVRQRLFSRKNSVLSDSSTNINTSINSAAIPLASPALNATRGWVDYDGVSPTNYTASNRYICTLPNGRNVVFWVDVNDTNVTSNILNLFSTAVCGASGGFSQLNGLLGDFWGSHTISELIVDTTSNKQDINIVFLKTPTTTEWAGYFYGGNNFISTTANPSNQALAFFINTNQIPLDPNFYVSTLIHEATHMAAFYQNNVVRNKNWVKTWLDETFAMMSEDIITPSLIDYNKISQYRLVNYMKSGGNTSLNQWLDLSGNHYNMGGTFGAFLNRQYGTSIYRQLVSACTATAAEKTDEYTCLDNLITSNGGLGIKDDLAKMGASIFAKMPATGMPTGYAFPARTDGAYSLQSIDLSLYTLAPANVITTYPSMSQTYFKENIATDKTSYIRKNVIVPANTTLHVVIK